MFDRAAVGVRSVSDHQRVVRRDVEWSQGVVKDLVVELLNAQLVGQRICGDKRIKPHVNERRADVKVNIADDPDSEASLRQGAKHCLGVSRKRIPQGDLPRTRRAQR